MLRRQLVLYIYLREVNTTTSTRSIKRMKSDSTIDLNLQNENDMNTINKPNEKDMNTNDSSVFVSSVYDREQTYTYLQFNNSTERPFDGPSYLVRRAISERNRLHEKMN